MFFRMLDGMGLIFCICVGHLPMSSTYARVLPSPSSPVTPPCARAR